MPWSDDGHACEMQSRMPKLKFWARHKQARSPGPVQPSEAAWPSMFGMHTLPQAGRLLKSCA